MTGIAALAFGAILASLDLWGWQLQHVYARLIGYDGCLCEQCRDYYLGGFWYEKFGCNGPRHDRLFAAAWLAGGGAALLVVPVAVRMIGKVGRRGRTGRCRGCGYDLTG